MTGRPNTLVGNEYWVRCPECGDSDKHYKAHLSINVDNGAFYCFRCGWSGCLGLSQLLSLIVDVGNFEVATDVPLIKPSEDPELKVGPGSGRFSLLERYYLLDPSDGKPWDGFVYRDPRGRATGYLLRRGDRSISYGRRTYLYPDPLGGPSTILRIVEGPYDVLYPEDVAVGGIIRPETIYRDLSPYQFIFCPDGDVWENQELLKPFLLGLYRVILRGAVAGVEYLPDGKDPDEVSKEDRIMFSVDQVLELIREVRNVA